MVWCSNGKHLQIHFMGYRLIGPHDHGLAEAGSYKTIQIRNFLAVFVPRATSGHKISDRRCWYVMLSATAGHG